jgi:hypothetical protein
MRPGVEAKTLVEPVVDDVIVEIAVGSFVGVRAADKAEEEFCEDAQPAEINTSPTRMPQKRGNL